MHSIKLIRKEPDFFLKKLGHRNINISLKSILDLDKKNRKLIQSKEKLEQEKKIISKKKDKRQFSRSKKISKSKNFTFETFLNFFSSNIIRVMNLRRCNFCTSS